MEKASPSEDSPQSKNETNKITNDGVKAPKSNQAWQSATLILAVAVIGLASYAIVLNYKNHETTKTNDELVEVISERDMQIEKLKKRLGRSYVDVIINTPEETSEDPKEPEAATEPQEPEQVDEAPIMNYVKSDGYVYIPQVGKKVKISEKFQTVYYVYGEDYIHLWGLPKEAMKSYDYMDINKNTGGIGGVSILSDDYIKYLSLKYDEPLSAYGTALLSANNNSVFSYYSSHAVYSEDKESQSMQLKATNYFRDIFDNKDNYEDM